MVSTEPEASEVYRLRFRVYVAEQGRGRLDGIDWERRELRDPLDACSHLWYAKYGPHIVGTITQAIIGPGFDLSRLPSAFEIPRLAQSAGPLGYTTRFAIAPEYRNLWVRPSLVRHAYAHGRMFGVKFASSLRVPRWCRCSSGWDTCAIRSHPSVSRTAAC
jgi:hypothetical protein